MLNTSRVLRYIKTHLGFNFQKLELSDQEIVDYISEFTIRTFSKYIPDTNRVYVDPTNPAYLVSSLISNEFLIEDPNGLEIISVIELYFDGANDFVLGHPVVGVFSYQELPDWTLRVNDARNARLFSQFDYTFEFKPPANIRVTPKPTSGFVVEYERLHHSNLGTIPNDLQDEFLKLSLSDIKIVIGGIRKKYGGNLQTPFGNIPLDIDILSEGKEERREVLEKLQTAIPNIVVDIG